MIPRGPWLTPKPPTDSQVAEVRRQHDLPQRFALYPAMTFPHKNHLRLFEALATLRDRHGIVLPLVCTGRSYEPHLPTVLQAIQRHRLEGQVFMLGAVSYETLGALFRAAWALVFPSLFEGLGLPVIEALQLGLPVIASDATCLPEVAGEAALLLRWAPRRVDRRDAGGGPPAAGPAGAGPTGGAVDTGALLLADGRRDVRRLLPCRGRPSPRRRATRLYEEAVAS